MFGTFKIGDLVSLKRNSYNGRSEDDIGIVVKLMTPQASYVFIFNVGCEFLFYNNQFEHYNV